MQRPFVHYGGFYPVFRVLFSIDTFIHYRDVYLLQRPFRAESKLTTAKQVWLESTVGIFLSRKSATPSP